MSRSARAANVRAKREQGPGERMTRILTITMNPSIDVSTSVERVIPGHKLRCGPSRRDPGGGGVNVARVLKRLEVDPVAFYTAGGERGHMLRGMLAREGIEGISLPISGDTREDFTVDETGTGNKFRFVSAGPELTEHEWRAALATIGHFRRTFAYIVASGSLPPGVPDDFYARVAEIGRAARDAVRARRFGPGAARRRCTAASISSSRASANCVR